MKRIEILLFCMMLAVLAYGQSDDVQSKEVYALVTVYTSTTRVEAKIDFGDGTKEKFFADEKGHRRKFASFFEPISMLIKDGWKIEHYTVFVAGSCQAVMKKKVKDESEIKKGIELTRGQIPCDAFTLTPLPG